MALGTGEEAGIWLKNWEGGRNVCVGTGGEGPLLASSLLLCSLLRGWDASPEGEGGVPWDSCQQIPKGASACCPEGQGEASS